MQIYKEKPDAYDMVLRIRHVVNLAWLWLYVWCAGYMQSPGYPSQHMGPPGGHYGQYNGHHAGASPAQQYYQQQHPQQAGPPGGMMGGGGGGAHPQGGHHYPYQGGAGHYQGTPSSHPHPMQHPPPGMYCNMLSHLSTLFTAHTRYETLN